MIKDPWRKYISLVVSELFRDPNAPLKNKVSHCWGFFLFCVVFNSLNTCFHCRVSTSMGNRAGFHTGYHLKRMINRSVCPAGLLIRSMEKSTKWPIRTLHMKVYGIGWQVQEKKKSQNYFCKAFHYWGQKTITEDKGSKKHHSRHRCQHCCQRLSWDLKNRFRCKTSSQMHTRLTYIHTVAHRWISQEMRRCRWWLATTTCGILKGW